MTEHRNALPEGHRIHWYVIQRMLGQGGFGITYLAEDTNLGRPVAIKEYLPDDMAFREADSSVHPLSPQIADSYNWGLDRFISEAQTLARFKHPNIVHVFSVFRENNTAYMIMEYEQGQGLDRILKDRKTLPEQELLNILIPLLDGLEQVHGFGFIHRDIKPPNIYIRKDGSPVLLDFGSARQSLGQRTQTLTAMFSPGFAPFEQYTGKGEYQGPWTDIYGLGATLYRAVTGHSPPNAMDRSEALLHNARDIYVPLTQIRPEGYSPALMAAIDKALSFKHEDRPQTIAAWRASLTQAGPATATTVVIERNPVPAVSVQKTIATGGTAKINRGNRKQPQPEATSSGWKRPAFVIMAVVLVIFFARHGHRRGNTALPATGAPAVSLEKSGGEAGPADEDQPDNKNFTASSSESETEAAATTTDASPGPEKPTPAAFSPPADHPANPGDKAGLERLQQLRRQLIQNPRDPEVRTRLRTTMQEYDQRIRQAMRNGQYDLAESYVKELLTIAPRNQKLRHSLQKIREMSRRRRM
jgi:serine/threonine protein kinase